MADPTGGGPVSPLTGTDAYLKIFKKKKKRKKNPSCVTSISNRFEVMKGTKIIADFLFFNSTSSTTIDASSIDWWSKG